MRGRRGGGRVRGRLVGDRRLYNLVVMPKMIDSTLSGACFSVSLGLYHDVCHADCCFL